MEWKTFTRETPTTRMEEDVYKWVRKASLIYREAWTAHERDPVSHSAAP